MLTRKSQH